MAGLLVSVRSAAEAIAASDGGATVIDVKEPSRGPLGRADAAVWHAVRAAVPADRPVSVALGELRELRSEELAGAFEGIAYRKLGLSGLGGSADWLDRWRAVRLELADGPSWVAVVYADWQAAGAPAPDAILDAALEARASGDCVGLLIDTWSKSRPSPLAADEEWTPRIERARAGGLFVALAGGLNESSFGRLAPLRPDLFAVRGAACAGTDRLGAVDRDRVDRLVEAARAVG